MSLASLTGANSLSGSYISFATVATPPVESLDESACIQRSVSMARPSSLAIDTSQPNRSVSLQQASLSADQQLLLMQNAGGGSSQRCPLQRRHFHKVSQQFPNENYINYAQLLQRQHLLKCENSSSGQLTGGGVGELSTTASSQDWTSTSCCTSASATISTIASSPSIGSSYYNPIHQQYERQKFHLESCTETSIDEAESVATDDGSITENNEKPVSTAAATTSNNNNSLHNNACHQAEPLLEFPRPDEDDDDDGGLVFRSDIVQRKYAVHGTNCPKSCDDSSNNNATPVADCIVNDGSYVSPITPTLAPASVTCCRDHYLHHAPYHNNKAHLEQVFTLNMAGVKQVNMCNGNSLKAFRFHVRID